MKKGFTLMELLAVIVIISLLLIIIIPTLLDAINSRRGESFLMNSKVVLQTINIYNEDYPEVDVTTINIDNIESLLGVKNNNYDSINVEYVNNEIFLTIIGKEEWQKYKACGFVHNMEIVSLNNNTKCNNLKAEALNKIKANAPILATGMTPIKYVEIGESGKWFITKENDLEWYDYEKKEWANAITEDGSMWVWIPRFAYQISSGYHTSSAGNINVKFLKGNTNDCADGTIIKFNPTYNGSSQTNYVLHPAFTFGNNELSGIWVAKFEASAGAGECYEIQSTQNCDVDTYNPISSPSMYSWRNISIKNIYSVIKKMTKPGNEYGFYSGNVDIHLMKNTEWGAIVYLSKSKYGAGSEVWINPANNFMTGCAGSSVSSNSTTGCLNVYDTINGKKTSTTNNVYGVYDMSGGAYEITMSNINNTNNGIFDISKIENKYKNIYTGYNNIIFGDAVYETPGWYSDQNTIPNTSSSYFIRGGMHNKGVNSGIYAYTNTDGKPNNEVGFRPVVILLK